LGRVAGSYRRIMDAHEFRERLRTIAREKAREPRTGRGKKERTAPLSEVWPTERADRFTIAEPPWPEYVPEPAVDTVRFERALVVDIEAMGLRDLPVFLVGFADVTGKGVNLEQYIAEHPDEETALLEATVERLAKADLNVTYNGRAYDFPFLSARCTYCRVEWPENVRHVDLLHVVRRRLGAGLPDCRLSTVEAVLAGIDRRRDVGSDSIPELYKSYVASGNGRVLAPVLEHNLIDTAATVLIYLELARRLPEDFAGIGDITVDNQEDLFSGTTR
jgi:uncharacterized protein YprB with RNaseH-like and TPR domain